MGTVADDSLNFESNACLVLNKENTESLFLEAEPSTPVESIQEEISVLSDKALKLNLEDNLCNSSTTEIISNSIDSNTQVKTKREKKPKPEEAPIFLEGSEVPLSKEQRKAYHSQRLAIKASNAFLATIDELNKELESIEVTQDWNDVPQDIEIADQTFFGEVSNPELFGPNVPWTTVQEDSSVTVPNSSIIGCGSTSETIVTEAIDEVIDGWASIPPISETELEDLSDVSETYDSEDTDFSDDSFFGLYSRSIQMSSRSTDTL